VCNTYDGLLNISIWSGRRSRGSKKKYSEMWTPPSRRHHHLGGEGWLKKNWKKSSAKKMPWIIRRY
jgi:hypothetical protein